MDILSCLGISPSFLEWLIHSLSLDFGSPCPNNSGSAKCIQRYRMLPECSQNYEHKQNVHPYGKEWPRVTTRTSASSVDEIFVLKTSSALIYYIDIRVGFYKMPVIQVGLLQNLLIKSLYLFECLPSIFVPSHPNLEDCINLEFHKTS